MSLQALVRSVVAEMLSQQGQCRHASVVSVDPVNALVKVQYDEQGTTSGWLPIAQQGAGNGWSQVTLPLTGAQVFVAPDMGDIGHGVVLGQVQSTQQPPGKITPYAATQQQPLTPGEPTWIHSSGASFRLTTGGVEINGNLKVNGTVTAYGDIQDQNGQHGTLAVLRSDYDQHQHAGGNGGAGLTGLTNKPTP